MANVLDSGKQQQLLALGKLGWTLRRIEHETGIRRETVSRYLKQAGIEVRPPGRWGHPDSKAAKEVIPDSDPPPRPGRNPSASACEPYRDLIEQAVRLGRNATVIWQDLVDDHGFDAGDQSVRRFVKKLRGPRAPVAHPVIETAPGEEGQVDYAGDGPMVRHPETGKYRRMRTVHLDGAVEVAGAYYHVPPGLISRRLRVQWDSLHVRILCPKTGELLREHVRQAKGRRRMKAEDRPAKTPESTVRLISRACNAGESTGIVCQAIHHADGEAGVRRILGVLNLVKHRGRNEVEAACSMALEMKLPTYQFVRRYLDRQPQLPVTLKQVDPLIRELTHYRDLIDRRLEGEVHEHD